jgi:hypothetical protein
MDVLAASLNLHRYVMRVVGLEQNAILAAPMSDAELLKPVEAARILGVSPRTLANWRSAGDGPKFSKVGGIRYRARDLKAFVRQKTVASTSEYDLFEAGKSNGSRS